MNFIDLTNIRHQEILIEEIIRAKRIIKQQKSKLAEAWPRKGQRAYDIKVGDRVVIKPPARKTSYRGTVVKINADGTFDWKDSKGELWSGSDIQVVSVNGAPPQEKTSDGDDNNNGYPDATENPLGDDDGMLVTKGHTALIIKPEDIAAFMAGKSVFAFGDDGKEYDIDRNMADVEWSDQEKKGPLELPNSRIVSIQADIITTRAGEKYKILTTKPNLKKPDLYVDMGFIERSGDPKKGYIQQIDPDDSYGLSTNGLQKVVPISVNESLDRIRGIIRETLKSYLKEDVGVYTRGIIDMLSPNRDPEFKNSEEVRNHLADKINAEGPDIKFLTTALQQYSKDNPEKMMDLNIEIQEMLELSTPRVSGGSGPTEPSRGFMGAKWTGD